MKKTRKFKRVMATILAMVTTATVVLTGCGNGEGEGSAKDDVVITFAGWGTLEEKKNFTKLVDMFEETHPGVRVNYQHYANSSIDYLVKLTANLAGNKMPDVFYLPTTDYRTWAQAGRLMELSDYLEKSEVYEEDNIWEKAMDMYRIDPKTGENKKNGEIYALPKDLGPYSMVYNKTLFEENGIPLPDKVEPMTQSEFIELAKKFTTGSGVDKVYGAANYSLHSAVWSNGADYLSEDKKTVTVDTPEFAEALQWTADLALVHGVAPTAAESATNGWFERFCNGKVAMAWMGAWQQPDFWEALSFEWDLMPTPVNDKTGLGISYVGTAALCVSAASKEQQIAYELIEYLCMNREAQVANYENGMSVPNLIDMEEEYLAMDKQPANKQVFMDILKDPAKGKFLPTYYTKGSAWYDYFEGELNKVYSGEMKATDFCKKIQPEMQEMLESK